MCVCVPELAGLGEHHTVLPNVPPPVRMEGGWFAGGLVPLLPRWGSSLGKACRDVDRGGVRWIENRVVHLSETKIRAGPNRCSGPLAK